MADQAPNIEPGAGRLAYDKEKRTIVAKPRDMSIDAMLELNDARASMLIV
jgi:hypothetical protein